MPDVDGAAWEALEGMRRLVEEAQAERDRLKGELATMTCMWRALVENAQKLHGEIKRLKSALAESRHLLLETRPRIAGDLGNRIDEFLAAPPAEQAQATYEDGEGKPAQLAHERLLSASAVFMPDWVAALSKRVDALEEWARRQVAEPWFDPERKAPPPPEAAVPGHAFVCRWVELHGAHNRDERCNNSCCWCHL